MEKSSHAFRTIREVAEWLGVAAHVLRFWESKFPQIKPVKRAGGRRYYRPSDMEFIGGIKVLLHDRGLTIRGVQRIIRENGIGAVSALSPPLDMETGAAEAELDNIFTEDEPDTPAAAAKIMEAEAPAPLQAEPPAAGAPVDPVEAVEDVEAASPDSIDQPSLALDLPEQAPPAMVAVAPHPAAPPAQDPDISAQLVRLAAYASAQMRLRPAQYSRLRPALVALRDKMQANPPA